ncbi:MAG: hypothetical protein RLZZ453_699 [Chlamydiota bacterium]|jgi:superfamily II DNA or RNA helicase
MNQLYQLEVEVQKDKHYLVFVVQGSQIDPHLRRLKRLSTNPSRLYCSADESFDFLKLFAARLSYQGKKVVVDPFSPLDVVVDLVYDRPDRATVTPKWQLKSQIVPFSQSDLIFPGDPPWALFQGIIRPFKVAHLPKEEILEGRALFAFLEKTGRTIEKIDPTPELILVDRHGAFAHLRFNYGMLGTVTTDEVHPWRNKRAEKGWEQDLIETGFSYKPMETSNYYCPLDEVAKSLTFLLEMGWPIFDKEGRRVCRQAGQQVDAALHEHGVSLKGKIRYAEHEADLEDVAGAFIRKERFLALNDSAVALIDPKQLPNFGEMEGLFIPKYRVDLLEPLCEQASLKDLLLPLVSRIPKEPILPSGSFRGQLFPYQKRGLEWLYSVESGLLADAMGLGKTVQLLSLFSLLETNKPSLIVVPTSLLFNWEGEFRKFLPSHTCIRFEGVWTPADFILVSYARLRRDADLFESQEFECVVLDEAQVIKNPDSQISLLCSRLKAKRRIAVTGTPIENRLDDVWALFRFIEPRLLNKNTPVEITRRRIRPFFLRRTKEEVGLQLPPKMEQTVLLEMSDEEREEYDTLLLKSRQGLEGKAVPEILEAILRLRQFCVRAGGTKLERVMVDLAEIVAEGRKVLVYSQFTTVLKQLKGQIQEQGWCYAYLDGSTQNREEEVCSFQNDPSVNIFLISLKAGGVGLNLTSADDVFLIDPWWNQAAEDQAIDRAHRLGRKGAVMARRYIMALTIEEKIMTLKKHKHNLLQTLFGEGGSLSIEEWLALLD